MLGSLIYTSSRNGLFPGNTGFSTVACNREMDLATRQKLEQLSGYAPLYPHFDPRSAQNPENFSHRVVTIAGRPVHVLSRICFNGMDYTQRSNKLASHLALSEEELARFAGGPGELLLDKTLFKEASWSIQPEYQPYPQPKEAKQPPANCQSWQTIAGDAGWAGAVLERILQAPQKTFYFVFAPEKHAFNLPLLREMLRLAPPPLRWKLTFSTYFTESVTGCECRLRFCTPDSPILALAKGRPESNEILDLREKLPPAQGGDYVVFARTGKCPQAASAPLSPVAPGARLRTPPSPAPYASRPMAPLPPPPSLPYSPPAMGGGAPMMAANGVKYSYCLVLVLLFLFTLGLYWRERSERIQREREIQEKDVMIQELWTAKLETLRPLEEVVNWRGMPMRFVALCERYAWSLAQGKKQEEGSRESGAEQKPGKAEKSSKSAEMGEKCAQVAKGILNNIRREHPGKEGERAYEEIDDLAKGLEEKGEYCFVLKAEEDAPVSYEIESVEWNRNTLDRQKTVVNIGNRGSIHMEMDGRFLFLRLQKPVISMSAALKEPGGENGLAAPQEEPWEGLKRTLEDGRLALSLKEGNRKVRICFYARKSNLPTPADPSPGDQKTAVPAAETSGEWRLVGYALRENEGKESPVAVVSWKSPQGGALPAGEISVEAWAGATVERQMDNTVEIRIPCFGEEWKKLCEKERDAWEEFRGRDFAPWVKEFQAHLEEEFFPRARKGPSRDESLEEEDLESRPEVKEQKRLNVLRERIWREVPLGRLMNLKDNMGLPIPEGLVILAKEEGLSCQKIQERRLDGHLPKGEQCLREWEEEPEKRKTSLEGEWKGKLTLCLPNGEKFAFQGFVKE
ncbi:MAG: hypothetical protein ACI4SG_06745 [Oligosphaeraceae bacterium]